MCSKLIVLSWLLFLTAEAWAQTESDPAIEALLESIADKSQSDDDFSELSEKLNYRKEHPFDLNTVTAEQLSELVFMSPLHAKNLITYRSESGPFTDIQELQLIDLFSWPLIEQLLPFVTINKPALLEKPGNGSASKLSWMTTFGKVLESQKGYNATDSMRHYEGSPYRLTSRLRYNYGDKISASVTMEKDAGERLSFRSGSYGFDFYSANIFVKGGRLIRKLAIGDYALQFGQGLALWSGLGFGKGASISGVAKVQSGLKPYSSTNESGFFRGLSATIVVRRLEITPFISYKKIDAVTTNADTLSSAQVSSLSLTGLHRTATELSKKNTESQLAYGSDVQYEHKGLRLGSLFYQTHLSKPLQENSLLYKKFDFTGATLMNGSLYYNYSWKNTYSFAELANSFGRGISMIGGLMVSLSRRVSAVVLYRNYQPQYYSFYSQSIAESSGVGNERGLYSGLQVRLNSKLECSFYTDLFKFPWMRYRVDGPSLGKEILAQMIWSPNKETRLSFRCRSVFKEQNSAIENPVNYLVPVEKDNYRLDLYYKIGRTWTLRNRAELVFYQKESDKQTGTVLYQDVIYKPLGGRLSGNCRVATFSTEGFDSRLYAFENDVLYSYAMSAYQDRGMRYYLNCRYRLNRKIDVWLRYAATVYTGKDQIGSDLDLISGSRKSDIKLQFRYVFE